MTHDEPAFQDDSAEGMAETAWRSIEKDLSQSMKNHQDEQKQVFKHFKCVACGSNDTTILRHQLIRRTTYHKLGSGVGNYAVHELRRAIEVGCANCLTDWIEEVPIDDQHITY